MGVPYRKSPDNSKLNEDTTQERNLIYTSVKPIDESESVIRLLHREFTIVENKSDTIQVDCK